MSRSVLSLVLAAAVALAAAFGTDGFDEVAASADVDEAAAARPAAADLPTPAPLTPGAATDGLTPRVVVPQRDMDIAAAPVPEPEPTPAPTAETTPAESRQLRGTGELLAAAGTSRDAVDRGGSTVRYSVEVEAATGLDPDVVAALVEEALYDERSWARDHDLRRVAPAEAWVHVVVASPGSVDALCMQAGLNTAGWLSCWNGEVAAINVDRWTHGVPHYDDLAQYRRYVVNHEVGHGLGHGHRDCPGDGRLAPLMQQQTKSLDGCLANEWRHPDA